MTILVDPARQRGLPCVFQTSVLVWDVATTVWESGVANAIGLYGLSRDQVLEACWFQSMYASSEWFVRWKSWADAAQLMMAAGQHVAVPDPPYAREHPENNGLCRWVAAAGDVIGRYCPDCGHSNALHSPTRPCAACEAIQVARDTP